MQTTEEVTFPLRLLHVEDSATEAELVLRELRRAGFVVEHTRVDDATSMSRALREKRPQIIIADFSMPRFDGLSALDLAQSVEPEVPFIFVSGTIGEERAVAALRRGATDYVLKGSLARLAPAVRRALEEADNRRSRARAERMLTRLIEGGPDPILVTTPTGDVTLANARADVLFGTAAGALLGRSVLDLVPARERQSFETVASRALRALGVPSSCEIQVIRADGGHVDVEVSVAAFDTDDDRWIAVTFRDISARRKQEALLVRIADWQAALSSVNEAIVRTHDRRELLESAAQIVVDVGKIDAVWIATLEPDGGHLSRDASAGNDDVDQAGLAMAREASRWFDLALPSAAQTPRAPARPPEPLTTFGSAGEECHALGFWSVLLVPLRLDASNVGVIAFFAKAERAFEQSSVGLLAQFAADLSLGLERMRRDEQIDYLARFDGLTGLGNRARFLERLDAALGAVDAPTMGVAVVDIQRFRHVSTSLGRAAGDAVLTEVASRLRAASCDPELAARLGADCFVATFAASTSDNAQAVATLVAAAIERPILIAGETLRLAGVAGYVVAPEDGVDADALLRNAETAAKAAKAGRVAACRYRPDMNADVVQRLSIETRLRRAIDNAQFVLHYQPKVDLLTGNIVGVEALVRWDEPERGLVAPGLFVPILEETGLIQAVGRWVISEALQRAATWRTRFRAPPRIAVNVSPLQVRRDDFVGELGKALRGAGQPPLDIEITESLFMDDFRGNVRKLAAIREMGVHVAIDDFGTGYSSLSYVAQLPIDTLKIDRSFITEMVRTPEAMAIASTMISLAHALRFSVVAEGVETSEQAHLLRLLRCDEVQGYYFGRPAPVEMIEEAIAAAEAGERRVATEPSSSR